MGSQVRTPVGYKVGLQAGTPVGHILGFQEAGTPVGPQSSNKYGFNSTAIPQPSILENQKYWTCVNEFGSETIAWTHEDLLPPPEPPPKCITPSNFLRVLHFNFSETRDKQTPLDIETRPLGVHRDSNPLFSKELPSDNVTLEIVGEVPSWDSFVDAWIDSLGPSALVHLYH